MSKVYPEGNGKEHPGLKADQKLLWIGIAFSIGFTFVLWFFSIGLQSRMEGIYGTFWPDFGAAWYYWQLPAEYFLCLMLKQ